MRTESELSTLRAMIDRGEMETEAVLDTACERLLEEIEPESPPCRHCGGAGYIAEHHPDCMDTRCCPDCPIQVECEYCGGSGREPAPDPRVMARNLGMEVDDGA